MTSHPRPREAAALAGIAAWTAALAVALSPATGLAAEWPQFHGPRRDNKSDETGLLKQWPAGGPTLLWRADGLGQGFASVAVAGGLLYTAGDAERHTTVTALDLRGAVRWTAEAGLAYKRGSPPGTRGTPTVDDGRVYYENPHGQVTCLNAATGKTLWTLDILKKFRGRNITWGLSESLLVDGDRVVCTPGGKEASLVALDKRTGRTVWICSGAGDPPGYCSPVVVEQGGLRQVVTMLARSVVGVHADTGKLLWRVEHVTPHDENISVPIVHGGCVLVSTQYTGARLLRLRVDGGRATAEQVWHSKALDNQHGGILLVGDCVYGSCRQASRGPWACLDFATGKSLYAERGIGRGSLTYADGLLYAVNHGRTVALVRPTPRAFEAISQFQIPAGGKGPTWAHPVVCGGRLYIRHGQFLYCYDIRAK